jgi:hypothetical protein
MTRQISAIERLQSLPELFRGGDLTLRFGWTGKTASQYLYLWRQRGLVEALGGHSDVFANLLQKRQANWEAALLMAMPSACIAGVESLRRAGWTTQIPSRPEVVVHKEHAMFTVERFDLLTRGDAWYEVTAPARVSAGTSAALPVLRPAWALADMLTSSRWEECGLTPDDIDWDVARARDKSDWRKACRALGADPRDAPRLTASSDEASTVHQRLTATRGCVRYTL